MNTTHTPFYSNENIEQRLDLLHHMLQFSDELLLVTGTEGIGKSAQLQELIERLGEGWQTCRLSGKAAPQISQLFEKVSGSFGFDYASVPSVELLNGFKHHLEQQGAGKTYALLIDDADQLNDSALEAVTHFSQLKNSKGQLLRVILFGNTTLSTAPVMKTLPFREVIIEPLDSEQSQSYINFCIEQGRYASDKPPSVAQQQKIVKRAGGIPGQIDAMLQNSSRGITIGGAVLNWRAVLLLLLLMAVGVEYLINGRGEEGVTSFFLEQQQPVLIAQPPTNLSITKPDIPADPQGEQSESSAPSELSEPSDPVKQPAPDREKSGSLLIGELLKKESLLVQKGAYSKQKSGKEVGTIKSASGAVLAGKSSENSVKTVPAAGGKISTKVASLKRKPKARTKRNILDGRVNDRSWLQRQKATSFTIQLVAAERESALDELIRREKLQKGLARFSFNRGGRTIHVLTQGIYAKRSGVEGAAKRYSKAVRPWIRQIGDLQRFFKANPTPVVKSRSATNTVKNGSLKDSAWMWSQDPEMITIQLMAGSNRATLEPYVGLSKRAGVSAILESKRGGKPWFILLYGHYNTREEARSAITRLPQTLRASKPWVRSFSSVHDEMSRSN